MSRLRNDLANDAFKLNGSFLEDEITGYTTLKCEGRETLEREWSNYTSTKADGLLTNYIRYPRREMKITYVLAATSSSDLDAQYEKLNKYLNFTNAEIIFNNESDKYLIGTLSHDKAIKMNKGRVAEGVFYIRCDNPFKYAVNETCVNAAAVYPIEDLQQYDSSASYVPGDMVKYSDRGYQCIDDTTGAWDNTKWQLITACAFTTNNDGNYTAFPRFEVTFATDEDNEGSVDTRADDGYIQFAKGEYALQFGDANEVQHTPQSIFNTVFKQNVRGDFLDFATDTEVPTTDYVDKGDITASADGLKPNYGKLSNKFHGSYIYAPAPAQANFQFTWSQIFSLSATTSTAKKQKGVFMAMVLDGSDKVIAGVKLLKDNGASTNGTVVYFTEDSVIDTKTIPFTITNPFGYVKKGGAARNSTNMISREGDEIIFNLACDEQRTVAFNCSTAAAVKVAFFQGQFGTTTAATNLIKSACFIDGDKPNTFTSSDLLEVNCNDGSVLLNSKSALNLGDIGNNWSNFYLDSGTNVIYVYWSDWMNTSYLPTCKMYYKKRWI